MQHNLRGHRCGIGQRSAADPDTSWARCHLWEADAEPDNSGTQQIDRGSGGATGLASAQEPVGK